MLKLIAAACATTCICLSLNSCVNSASGHGTHVGESTVGKLLANHPTVEQRKQSIATEQSGDHYIGRRYFVKNTTFWGYLRKPKHNWYTSKLVVFNEDQKLNPDRLPEDGPGNNYGFDQNYEYKIWGHYTGANIYDPNSNRWLPEFKLQNYEAINTDPGWIFSPKDRYLKDAITLGHR